ncbi:Guanine deaminase [Lamellibrachia satsuma]|nr:Guanine deaminase [Lamellibrachia satsuma]
MSYIGIQYHEGHSGDVIRRNAVTRGPQRGCHTLGCSTTRATAGMSYIGMQYHEGHSGGVIHRDAVPRGPQRGCHTSECSTTRATAGVSYTGMQYHEGHSGNVIHRDAVPRGPQRGCHTSECSTTRATTEMSYVGMQYHEGHSGDVIRRNAVPQGPQRRCTTEAVCPSCSPLRYRSVLPCSDNLCSTGLDLPLLEWLPRYTFPLEASFGDVTFAAAAYRKVVTRLLKNGTTTACYFATIHTEGTLQLCDIIEDVGQRAFVGKVCMDQHAPGYYVEDTAKSVSDTERFVQNVLNRKNELLQPVVTPRFAVSATQELMTQLARVASKYGVRVQVAMPQYLAILGQTYDSHLSESPGECKLISSMFPDAKHYTEVYKTAGLLNAKTVMAHCNHLSDDEVDLIKQTSTGVAHCPNSNISVQSGLCDVRRLLDKEIKVGLGTDVSGGYSPSMLDAIRYTAQTSNILSVSRDEHYTRLDYREAFRLATLGGSQVLGIEDRVGNFIVGKEFDVLRINPSVANSPFDIFDKDTVDDMIQKFFYLGDDRNIVEVFVAGQRVLPN